MNQQWIFRPAFPAVLETSYEVSFGKVQYQGKLGDWTAKIRIEGASRDRWIDLDTGLPLDAELAKYVVQAYREL